MPTNPIITPVIMSKVPPNPNATVTRGCSGSFSSDFGYQSSVVLILPEVGTTVGAMEVEDEVVDGVMLVVKVEEEALSDEDATELSVLLALVLPVDSELAAVCVSSSSFSGLL